MSRNRTVLAAVVIIVIAVGGWWLFHRGGAQRIDLLTQYDQARKDGSPWSVIDATLAGDTKRAIAAPPDGRIHFTVRVPDDGWLRVSLGMQPASWDKEGDGVYFFAGISDGRAYEQLFTQTLNPYKNQTERKWIPVTVDLSAYAGEDVEILLNTRGSSPTPPGQNDTRNDLPLWGAPEIVRR
ncbi:MAG TPA: hypothetical protein VGL62_09720 [Vicinamibacterales bacterium]|jgi:hypothetical protein